MLTVAFVILFAVFVVVMAFSIVISGKLTYKAPENDLIILRGLPGSGKSTFAGILSGGDGRIVCCADDFFMVDGEYKFDINLIGSAHKSCEKKCRLLMMHNEPRIIVANTGTTEKEINTYINMAEEYGYRVFSVVVENRHEGISVHGVPEETLQRMKDRFTIKL